MRQIRKTKLSELDEVMEVYAYARRFMAEHGNPNQCVVDYRESNHRTETEKHKLASRSRVDVGVYMCGSCCAFYFLPIWKSERPDPAIII